MLINGTKIMKVIGLCNNSEIHGRLRLQKTIHILKHLGFSFNENYTYLYYGPYSYDLFDEVKQLSLWKLLREEKGSSDEYVYQLTDDGRKMLSENSNLLKDQHLPEKEIIELLENQDSRTLEMLSTFYYLKEQGLQEETAWSRLDNLKKDKINNKPLALQLDSELKKLMAG